MLSMVYWQHHRVLGRRRTVFSYIYGGSRDLVLRGLVGNRVWGWLGLGMELNVGMRGINKQMHLNGYVREINVHLHSRGSHLCWPPVGRGWM